MPYACMYYVYTNMSAGLKFGPLRKASQITITY